MSSRRLLAAAASVVAAAALAVPAAASASQPSPSDPAGHIGGIVPVHNGGHTSGSLRSGSNLSYHGGPVMTTNTVYTIYWLPSGYNVSTSYRSIIDGFFTNVGKASNTNGNVYAIDTQYSGIKYSQSYSASSNSYLDTTGYPANGCTDKDTTICLSDAQIQTEIAKDIPHFSGVHLSTSLFVLLTADGVGSCSGSSCAFTQYCAYHGSASYSGGVFQYANMPYADTVSAACDSGQYPNGDPAADSEINILSHEQNEAITDPQLNAWYDQRGYEIGDKCAWNFGTASGPAGAQYNQTINGGTYYLQQEWSNKSSGCALTYP